MLPRGVQIEQGFFYVKPRDGDKPPTVEEMMYDTNLPFSVSCEPFFDWLFVAVDPHRVAYFDDDSQAMDETNWNALIDRLSATDDGNEIPRSYQVREGLTWSLGGDIDDAMREGIAFLGNVLVMRSDHPDLSVVQECQRALSDYPFLDESSYSEREYEAWQEYAPTAFGDELKYEYKHLDEDTAEAMEDQTNDLLNALCDGLDHYSGFSGEYSPNFVDIFAKRLVAQLMAGRF